LKARSYVLCFHGLFAHFFKSRGLGDERVKFLGKKGDILQQLRRRNGPSAFWEIKQ
jgi:hypothetical protein